jgi:hypothetical protein
MRLNFFFIILACIFLVALDVMSYGYEIKSHYATINYEKEEYLIKFSEAIAPGSPSYSSSNRRTLTAEEVVIQEIDELIEKVKRLLDLFPEEVKFRIVLLPLNDDVRRIYSARYRTHVDYIAFYALEDKTVFISINDVSIRVLAHELAHVVLDHSFYGCPSVDVQENLARFVETHIEY